MSSPSTTPSHFSQRLRSYAYTPQPLCTALSLPSTPVSKRKRPENSLPALTVTRPSKNTSERHVSPAIHYSRSKSVTTSHQLTVAGETSIYFTPDASTSSRRLLDGLDILVKSTDVTSVQVSERKRKLEPSGAFDAYRQKHVLSVEPPESEMEIPATTRCYKTPHEVHSALPTPSSQPRWRRKPAPSIQLSTISLDTTTTQPAVINRTSTDTTALTTSKYFCKGVQPGKLWVHSFFPSEHLFTHNYMPAFPSYHQDLFNDLIGYIANAKPILIQEAVSDNPWQLLISVKLLNVTTGRYAIPVFWKLMDRWPTPHNMLYADNTELVNILRPLGLYNKRAAWLKAMSQHYIDDPPTDILRPSNCHLEIPVRPKLKITAPTYKNPRKRSRPESCSSSKKPRKTTVPYPPTPISHYPGIGRYALDSYRIFCTTSEEWKEVMPQDKELIRYLRWRWAYEERKIWYPDGVGVVKDVDIPYLLILVDELMEKLEPDEFWGATDFVSG